MPAKMRAFFTSSSADAKLLNDRTTPGIWSDSMVKCVLSPKRFASTAAAAPLRHEWADGYYGCAGVAKRGIHVGSSFVAGLPSVAARGMAVTGRQNT